MLHSVHIVINSKQNNSVLNDLEEVMHSQNKYIIDSIV